MNGCPSRREYPLFFSALRNRLVVVRVRGLSRAAAQHCMAEGMNVREFQDLLRHAKLETTVLYTGLDARQVRKAVEGADPREGMRSLLPPRDPAGPPEGGGS